MANPEHLAMLHQGLEHWNAWRAENPATLPILSHTDLSNRNFNHYDLHQADLQHCDLSYVSLDEANLQGAYLNHANLQQASLRSADFTRAVLSFANLGHANAQYAIFAFALLLEANLTQCMLWRADLTSADFSGADLSRATMCETQLDLANLNGAKFDGADLSNAKIFSASMHSASFIGANLTDARLNFSLLAKTDFTNANLSGCSVYGTSAWDLNLDGATQSNLLITTDDEPPIRVDDLELAQFIHLLMSRQKLRNVILTMGEKAVLILGRFTERKELLDRMADKLRSLGFLPMIFDFERPTDRDLTETIKIIAGLSRFVIADITNPRSVPLELQATVPDYMVPFVTILERGQSAFGMFDDLPRKYHWALPLLEYRNADTLLAAFEDKVVTPALEKADEVRREKSAPKLRRSAED